MTTTLEPKGKLDAAPDAGGANGPEGEPCDWSAIDWDAAEDNVRRLRQRIFTASRAGDLAKVLMFRSYAAAAAQARA